MIRFRLTMMIILMSLAWCMMPMEPSLAPLRAPPLWGHFVICNHFKLVIWYSGATSGQSQEREGGSI